MFVFSLRSRLYLGKYKQFSLRLVWKIVLRVPFQIFIPVFFLSLVFSNRIIATDDFNRVIFFQIRFPSSTIIVSLNDKRSCST